MSQFFSLNEEVAVVTGVLGLLGPVWSEALLSVGCTVVGLDLPGKKIPPSFSDLHNRFGKEHLHLFEVDICQRDALLDLRDLCLNEIGIPGILVNNAGIDQAPKSVQSYRLEDIPLDIFHDIFAVNIFGAFQVTQIFGAEMLKKKKGSIINIGSLYAGVSPDIRFYDHIKGDVPFLKPPAYGASKAALANLTKYFSTHWGPYGVRVNTLSPGGVLGEQDELFKKKFSARVPMGRMASHRDLQGPLIFLASDASSYVTGIEVKVDGGYTAW